MNRNTEQHFATIPEAEIGRSKFDRSKSYKTTFNTGDIIPIYVDATIMPGDTVKMNMGSLIRMITPIAPTLDSLWMDTYFFFCPNRLVWDDFTAFMGENTNPWKQTSTVTVPKIRLHANNAADTSYKVESGSLLNYMGIPLNLGVSNATNTQHAIKVNALPIRSYLKIWSDWFRDQNTETEAYFSHNSTDIDFESKTYAEATYTTEAQKIANAYRGSICLKANRIHDYFSSGLPEPQKGPSTLVPLVGEAPIIFGQGRLAAEASSIPKHDITGATGNRAGVEYTGSGPYEIPVINSNAVSIQKPPVNGVIELQVDMANAVGATVNAIRQAFAIQKFYERQARGGTRYIEMVQSHFNVTNPDFRLQRSEYLGGKRFPIAINQVIQTVADSSEPLGNTGAYSVTSDNSEDLFVHSFTEHGCLIGLAVVRTARTYQQGIEKQWFMNKLTDFYFPEFANLGEMPIYNKEIFAQDGSAQAMTDNDNVFAYQEAWGHYRYQNDQVTGELSSMYSTPLDIWHYADYYSTLPTLSPEWELENKDNVKRTLTYQNGHQFIADFYFSSVYTRPMPLYSVPGLVDHH